MQELLEITRARAVTALPSTCDIATVTMTTDGLGGFTESTETSASGVACRAANVTRRHQDVPEGVRATAQVVVYLPWGTGLEVGDRIIVGGYSLPVYAVTRNDSGIYVVAWCGSGNPS